MEIVGKEAKESPLEIIKIAHRKHSTVANRIEFKGSDLNQMMGDELLLKMYEYVKNANNFFCTQPPTPTYAIFSLFLANEHTSSRGITTGQPPLHLRQRSLESEQRQAVWKLKNSSFHLHLCPGWWQILLHEFPA